MPLKANTVAELKDIETSLKSVEQRAQMMEQLCTLGGASLRDGIKRMMDKMMTNELMSGFNLKGNKNKMAFGTTSLCKVIIGAATRQYDATEHTAAFEVARILKYAPDRKGGSGRNMNVNGLHID